LGQLQKSGLDGIVTQALDDLPVLSCRYGTMLNESGGIIDDLIVFREDVEKWFLVVNGATTDKDVAHIQNHLTDDAVFKDLSSDLGKLDLQGPLSREVLKKLAPGIERLNYYSFDYFELLGEKVLISRTGYTGELGYEIYFPWEETPELWNALLQDDRVQPAGLGARDILRLEVGYSLYGHELSEVINPIEGGLKKFINFDKNFIGKNALMQYLNDGIARKTVGILSQNRKSPRAGDKIYTPELEEIGEVTSGSFSPCLKKGIGLGLISKPEAQLNEPILIGNLESQFSANIASKFFFKDGSLKS
ncbi:MAG: glycine cleavage system protein T, partial [Candidatus Omnitrophica bacterium]|nr:glycine cleavage system protein T [Candidatus Omnitrophota bacterium]